MDARQIIEKLRDKRPLEPAELNVFAQGLASGAVTDAQAGAFAMAALLNGMSDPDRVALTLAMRDSGDVMRWDLPAPAIDKHSTGGVGDCVSLLLAPALAAMGACVPMVSGRGLGHTGGTLDKLESIPGLKTEVSDARFREIVERVGCAIVSASGSIAPADKRLYAIRDVTGTVESIDLITASILSKKLAAGLEALVLDVKCGSGAFMTSVEDARALAQSLVTTANGAGCKTSVLITDMNQPLCPSLGNALEIMTVMEAMTTGEVDNILCDVTCALGGELLVLAGLAEDVERATWAVRDTLTDGSAAERFGQMISELGGPADFVDHWRDRLPSAPVVRDVMAGQSGYVCGMDGHALGMAVVHLGGGRLKGGEKIDPAVGLSNCCMIGEYLDADSLVATIHAKTAEDADKAEAAIRAAIRLGETAPDEPPLIYEKVTV
ncbi:thymidine phosphorylase [Celeribacter halophilus]|uniref:Thymidine phosphorylase n=1 Tax=Celeribacter halophilus TaxID=576117 RepID=A0AAW7XXY0_9RHOB|nr:thymidine phosphorylase [Celeribacter halophilus]MDO6458209.1 thymidine phosphorylase [Celeribacter halophilus]MDO6724814.1 thymidine phosphorylase [Celeribacter halophilus]